MKKILFTLMVLLLALTMGMAINADTVKKGESISLPVIIENEATNIKAGSVSFTYDKNALELVNGEWTINDTVIKKFDIASERGVVGFANPQALSGQCFSVEFKVKDTALYQEYKVYASFKFENSEGFEITRQVELSIEVFCPHSSLSTINGEEPSCTKTGLTEGIYCETCNKIIKEQEIINKEPHTYTLKNETANALKEEASCTHADIYYLSCANCGEVGEEETFEVGEILPHEYNQMVATDYYKITEATCKRKATYLYSCACGKEGTEAFESGYYTLHSFEVMAKGEKFVKDAPSCTEGGSYYYSCSCGEIGTGIFDVEPLGHSYNGYKYNNDATCTENGTKTGICIRCNEEATFEDTEHRESHKMSEWQITKRPDYENEGKKERYCLVCNGEKEEETLNKLVPSKPQTSKGENAPSIEIKDNVSDLILTEEEREQVELGASLDTRIEINDVEAQVTNQEKELVEIEISKLKNKYSIGMYLDISMFKTIGNNSEEAITDLNGEMTIEIDVPEKLQSKNPLSKRSYKLIHLHNGETEVLDCSYDKESGKLSFNTKGFSTFALAYTDDNTTLIIAGAAAVILVVLLIAVIAVRKKNSRKRRRR